MSTVIMLKSVSGNKKSANSFVVSGVKLIFDVVIAKRSLYISTKDLAILGLYDRRHATMLGIALAYLHKCGLAKKLRKHYVKYRLSPIIKEVIEKGCTVENPQCLNGETLCGLINICPIHKLKVIRNGEKN